MMKKSAWIGTIVSVAAFLAFNPFAWADPLPAYTTESLVGVYKDEFYVIDPTGSHESSELEDLDHIKAATVAGDQLVVYDKDDGWGTISLKDGTYSEIDYDGRDNKTVKDIAYGDGYIFAVDKDKKKTIEILAYSSEYGTLEYTGTIDTDKKVEGVAYDNGYLYYAYKEGKIKIDVTHVYDDGTTSGTTTYETDDNKIYGITIVDGQLYYASRDEETDLIEINYINLELEDDGVTFGEHHAFGTSLKKLAGLAYIPLFDEDYEGEGGGAPVPEPGTLLLIGSGLVGLGVGARRRSHRK